MKLTVIVATYNRNMLLKRTLASLLSANVPTGLNVSVIVVDNNSTDNTRDVVAECERSHGDRVRYVFEGRQGKSYALNTGIANTRSELIAFVDDDEEIEAGWYDAVTRAFQDPTVDFIGGRTVPNWGSPPPEWLPEDYRAVVGWADAGERTGQYGLDHPGMPMGGNTVVRRTVLNRLGENAYSVNVGRMGKGLLTADDDFFNRLLDVSARGLYLPDLVVRHYVRPEMLTKTYHVKWCFWNSVSLGLLDRKKRSPVTYLFGIPRWYLKPAFLGMLYYGSQLIVQPKDRSLAMSRQLDLIRLIGFAYGKFFFRPDIRNLFGLWGLKR